MLYNNTTCKHPSAFERSTSGCILLLSNHMVRTENQRIQRELNFDLVFHVQYLHRVELGRASFRGERPGLSNVVLSSNYAQKKPFPTQSPLKPPISTVPTLLAIYPLRSSQLISEALHFDRASSVNFLRAYKQSPP